MRVLGKLIICFCVAAMAVVPCAPNAEAVPQAMMTGLQQLNNGEHRSALASFLQASKEAPNDVQVRYCLAVAYHHLGFLEEAEQQYAWVVKSSKDPNLTRRANKGIAAARGANGPMGPVGGVSTAEMLSREQVYQQFGRAAASKPPLYTPGMPSIVNFWVEWCGWSTRMRKMLVEANQKYGSRVKFVLVNAEAKRDLADKWGVGSYPTTFFFDAAGNMVDVCEGCPKQMADLEQMLKECVPEIDPNYKPPKVVPTRPGTITSFAPRTSL